MKAILYVVDTMNRGGAETFLMNVLRNIDRRRYAVHFLCFGDKTFDYQDEIEQLGGNIIRIQRHANPLRLIGAIRSVIRQYNIDIVHSHIQLASMYSMIAAKLERVPVRIMHSHLTSAGKGGGVVYKIYEKLAKKGIAWCSTHRLACGEEAGRYLFGGRSFEIITNGIQLSDFAFIPENRRLFRRRYHLGEDDFLVGMVARLEEVKNHQFAIKMFRHYQKKNPRAKLVLAGQGSLREQLEQLAEQEGMSENVRFLGLVEDTAGLYSALDVLIMPSLYEGLPVSLIEAQASSLPCLCSDQVDRDSNAGGLVEFLSIGNEDYDIWINAIAVNEGQKRKHNNDVVNNLTQNGYNIHKTVKRLEELYQ